MSRVAAGLGRGQVSREGELLCGVEGSLCLRLRQVGGPDSAVVQAHHHLSLRHRSTAACSQPFTVSRQGRMQDAICVKILIRQTIPHRV
jgi:hypothetical protein